jgi:hypothetical protein
MKAWGRNERAKARQQVEGIEEHGGRAVLPWRLEANGEAAIAVVFEAVQAKRWPGDVAAEALEALAVTAVDRDGSVNVHPADLGEREVWVGHERNRTDELVGLVVRSDAEELAVGGRRAIARREDGLLVLEPVGLLDRSLGRSVSAADAAGGRRQTHRAAGRVLFSLVAASSSRLVNWWTYNTPVGSAIGATYEAT